VNGILEARATELFGFVRAELERVGMERALMGGVYLAGGGARMPDLCDIAERELQCQARYALPFGIRDWPEWMNDPEWTTAAGLAMYSATLKVQTARLKEHAGWLGKVLRGT
jgi:cell division protein FtsA